MIYTLTLNPAIDQIINVSKFDLGATNKAQEQYQILGGKGINVSVMLQNLGYENIALAFCSESDHSLFQNYLKTQKIKSDFHLVSGQTRLNLKIRDLTSNQETELNCLGFQISEKDETAILTLVEKNLTKEDTLIISGSAPLGGTKNLYQTISQFCFEKQIPFVVDATGENLMATLQYHPLLIKPNLAELNQIFKTNFQFDQLKEINQQARKLLQLGAQNVLVSNGKHGSLLITNSQSYLANTATGDLVNSVGAGDSMVAGFVGTYKKTKDYKNSLLVSAAAGAATAFSKGIAELELVNKLKEQIKITLIKE